MATLTKISDQSEPDVEQAHGSTQAGVESEAARMARLLTSPDFRYEPSAKLGAARQRLTALESEREQQGGRASALQQAADAAQSALLKMQTRVALGEVKPADVAAAQAVHESARANLAASSPNSDALRREIAAVAARVETLLAEELAGNRQRLRPLYRKAVEKANRLTAAAAAAHEELRALKHVGGPAAKYWPGEMGGLTPTLIIGVRGSCEYDEWRKACKAMGLMD